MCFKDFRQLVLHAVLLASGPHVSIGTRTFTYMCQWACCLLVQAAFPWRLICRLSFLCILSKRETPPQCVSPFTKMRDAHSIGVSPFCFTRKHTLHYKLNTKLQRTAHTSEIAIFSHIEHISQQYPMKVKFPHK
jgi:hypothetical protein